MDLDKIFRRILGLPTKEDQLRSRGAKIIENIQCKAYMTQRIPQLTNIMGNEVTPRLSANIHDLEAVGMLEEIID